MKLLLALCFLIEYSSSASVRIGVNDGVEGVCETLTQTFTIQGTSYIFFNQRVTWDEAAAICPSYKARLAVITKASHASFLGLSLSEADRLYKVDAMWVGGRKQQNGDWLWSNGEQITVFRGQHYDVREPFRTDKDCVALVRQAHKGSSFADLTCSLTKPFICQRSRKVDDSSPLPTNWILHKGFTYIVYTAHIPWHKAVSFCRNHGMRLAKFRDSNIGYIMKGLMTQSRPSIEMAWLAGHSVNGQWIWVTDGSTLATVKNASIDYPPWRDELEPNKEGCLVFDKHDCMPGVYLSLNCQRKRSFICEQEEMASVEDEQESTTMFDCGSQVCVLVDEKMPWFNAWQYCKTRYKTDLVKLQSNEHAALISDAMSDHALEFKHVWIGGHQDRGGEWKWTVDDSVIPLPAPSRGGSFEGIPFPPWCNVDMGGLIVDQELCLNMDRTDYRLFVMYGMACNTTQSFVCAMGPNTQNGE